MGGDHGHGHGDSLPKVPDWRKYKWEDIPELAQVQKMLAQKGLKDPWMRNEVWRFDPKEFGPYNNYKKAGYTLFKGFKWGLAAAIICTIYTKMTEHGHHGHHDSESHH